MTDNDSERDSAKLWLWRRPPAPPRRIALLQGFIALPSDMTIPKQMRAPLSESDAQVRAYVYRGESGRGDVRARRLLDQFERALTLAGLDHVLVDRLRLPDGNPQCPARMPGKQAYVEIHVTGRDAGVELPAACRPLRL